MHQIGEDHARIAEHDETLVQQVSERTADLELKNAQLGMANRAKGTFLAAMSHEIRTP